MWLPNPKLSPRMRIFIDHALEGEELWDVCCDHGYVGIRAMEIGCFPAVHFVDQVPHIMDRLQKLINQSKKIPEGVTYQLHRLPGQDIDVNVNGTLLIAGVGGLTIKTILASLIEKGRLGAKKLLLSPHTDEKVLVEYLSSASFLSAYSVTEKILIPEGKRHRPMYIALLKTP